MEKLCNTGLCNHVGECWLKMIARQSSQAPKLNWSALGGRPRTPFEQLKSFAMNTEDKWFGNRIIKKSILGATLSGCPNYLLESITIILAPTVPVITGATLSLYGLIAKAGEMPFFNPDTLRFTINIMPDIFRQNPANFLEVMGITFAVAILSSLLPTVLTNQPGYGIEN